MARVLRGMADRDDSEAAPVQGVGRVGYFDLFGPRGWVVEGGIMLLDRLTTWITATCGSFFNFGCVMACCYA